MKLQDTRQGRSILIGMFILSMILAGVAAPASPQNTEDPEKPRILVLPVGPRLDLAREAVHLMVQGLMEHGYPVVNPAWADHLQSVSCRNAKGKGLSIADANRSLGRKTFAGILVRLGVQVQKERKQQGRYRVEDRIRVTMINLEDASILLEKSAGSAAASFDSFGKAHRKALVTLCTPGKYSPVSSTVARLDALLAEEKELGSVFTLGLHVGREDRTFAATFAGKLRNIQRVRPETVSLVRSNTVPLDRAGSRSYFEYRLRYRGRSHGLVEALFTLANKMSEAAREGGQEVSVDFAASTRRVVLFLTTRRIEPETCLDKEVESQVNRLVEKMMGNTTEALSGKRLAVEPAAIPASQGPRARLTAFARGFFRALAAAERKSGTEETAAAAGGALDIGPVTLGGTEFPTLRAARAHLDVLAGKYRGSRSGSLALDISKLVAQALRKKSKGKLSVLTGEEELTTVLDRIKREASSYQEEGSVDPGSIAFLRTSGAEAVVLPCLRPFLKSYVIRITIVDCTSGEELVHLSHVFDEKFKADLEKTVNS